MNISFFQGVRKVAYSLAKLIELPYDLVKTLTVAADMLPENWGREYENVDGHVYTKNQPGGWILKGLFNLVLMPTQWLMGVVYQITGLRQFANWLREASDRKVLQCIEGDSARAKSKIELLGFLQKQRRKNNSGRGVFTYDEGNHFDPSLPPINSVSCIGRRQEVDACLDDLLTPHKDQGGTSYRRVLGYLNNCLQKLTKKVTPLPAAINPSSDLNKKNISQVVQYCEHPTNIFYIKKTESKENRKVRLDNNMESLVRMRAGIESK